MAPWEWTMSEGQTIGAGTCALCRREVRVLTRHHLIPRCRHDARLRRRVPGRAEAERATVGLCRPCHVNVHQNVSEKDLARHFATIDLLASEPRIAAFARWIARRPDGTAVPSASRKRR